MSKSKKRNRSVDSSSSIHSNSCGLDKHQSLQDDNRELFLQAFEKPTQIYRYLRSRHLYSPIFIYRTLSYMRHRMSRTHKRRKDFKIDSVLRRVEEHKNDMETSQERRSQNLSIIFKAVRGNGFYADKTAVIRIDVSLLTTCHKTKKASSCPAAPIEIARCELALSHLNTSNAKVITIRKENFNSSKSNLVKSYCLKLSASYHTPPSNDLMSEDLSSDESSNNCCKKPKLSSGSNQKFVAELVVFDKNRRCLLEDGDYEIALNEERKAPSVNGTCGRYKISSWEPVQTSNKLNGFPPGGPIVSFKLIWNNNHINGLSLSPKTVLSSSLELSNIENNSLISNHSNGLVNGKSSSGLSSNSSSPKSKASQSDCGKSSGLIVYQFVFNNNTVQQTRSCDDFKCPWCTTNCAHINCLLKHLRLCHSRLNFFHVVEQKGHRIDVTINETYDGSYSGNPQDLSHATTGFAFSRNGPVRRTPVTHVLVCKARRFYQSFTEGLDPDEVETAIRPFVSGHNRLYFHTDTCLPITPPEMDEDSEAEYDPEWLRSKTQLMIDEFTDVNEGEKEVMKMWNLHVMKFGYVGDCQIMTACMQFVDHNFDELNGRNLYRNFVLHLCNLYDFGLLSASSLRTVVRRFQQHKCQQEALEGKAQIKLESETLND